MDLTQEQKKILGSYLNTFTSPDGRVVLDDFRKSYFDRPFDESRFNEPSYMVQRATEFNVYLKIVRMIERAAEEIQRVEGFEPARMPEVVTEEEP